MLPVAYRVVKGFATFFGVMGVISCICGLIAGIIMNGGDDKKPITPSPGTSATPSESGSQRTPGPTGPAGARGSDTGSSGSSSGSSNGGGVPGVGVPGAVSPATALGSTLNAVFWK